MQLSDARIEEINQGIELRIKKTFLANVRREKMILKTQKENAAWQKEESKKPLKTKKKKLSLINF